MSPKSPAPSTYSSFDAIEIGSKVHLRLIGDDETVEPRYIDAELISTPTPNGPNHEFSATFRVPGNHVTVSEVQYKAWTRYGKRWS
ncbi:hypothetical protein [Curtobacterium sp. MCBA15_012]|uniref:hypothetical protein n=1 Tax=Curtobacterium sp. MCBA15_012 TaxID=1898738 RepID=UPI000825C4F5|nr:hypothetical protein [Curtobacterium sp. MCBA15_012]WIB00383.1 hypothetical protein QOL15_01450 [Curtobacterium sp. MCBA15_012]